MKWINREREKKTIILCTYSICEHHGRQCSPRGKRIPCGADREDGCSGTGLSSGRCRRGGARQFDRIRRKSDAFYYSWRIFAFSSAKARTYNGTTVSWALSIDVRVLLSHKAGPGVALAPTLYLRHRHRDLAVLTRSGCRRS